MSAGNRHRSASKILKLRVISGSIAKIRVIVSFSHIMCQVIFKLVGSSVLEANLCLRMVYTKRRYEVVNGSDLRRPVHSRPSRQ